MIKTAIVIDRLIRFSYLWIYGSSNHTMFDYNDPRMNKIFRDFVFVLLFWKGGDTHSKFCVKRV